MAGRWLIPLLLLGVAWGQELIDQLLFQGRWNLPMGPGLPLWGVLTAPFSHAGFGHLLSNSLVFVPLSWLVLSRGMRDYIAVWLGVLLVAVPIALVWPSASHGLSGVVYGLLGYLLLIGWLERRIVPILLGLLSLWLYGSALFALIPGCPPPASVGWAMQEGFLAVCWRQRLSNGSQGQADRLRDRAPERPGGEPCRPQNPVDGSRDGNTTAAPRRRSSRWRHAGRCGHPPAHTCANG